MSRYLRELRICVALLAGCAFGAGCRAAAKVRVTDSGAPQYEQVRIEYDLNGRFRDLPLRDPSIVQVSGTADSARGAAPSRSERWSGATLSIDYPHPDGVANMARATLRLSSHRSAALPKTADSKPTESPFGVKLFGLSDWWGGSERPAESAPKPTAQDDEIWVLDFPKPQLDLMLVDLAQSGFFDSQYRTEAGTQLVVEVNKGKVSKQWTPEPRLDDFITRVHTAGRLTGFVSRPPTQPGA